MAKPEEKTREYLSVRLNEHDYALLRKIVKKIEATVGVPASHSAIVRRGLLLYAEELEVK